VTLLGAGCGRYIIEGSEAGGGATEEGEGGPEEPPWEDPEEPEQPPTCGDGVIDEGEFCHELYSTTPSGIDPCALAVADFDHDGRPDCAVPNSDFINADDDSHVANILLGKGDGNLHSAVGYYAGQPLPVGIDNGDFNDDGDPDIVVANWEAEEVNVLLGDGNGGLGAPTAIDIGDITNSVGAGDIDGNGRTDIIASVANTYGVAVVRSYEDGYGAVEWVELDSPTTHAIFADVNHDGAPDLLATLNYPYQLSVALNDGTGEFEAEKNFDLSGLWPQWIYAEDMDGDGRVDVLTANQDGNVEILLGSGNGQFGSAYKVEVGQNLQSVVAADFNMDGEIDIAASDQDYNTVIVMTADGGGDYFKQKTFAVGARPVSIRSADFNLDGVPDLAVANQLGNSVSVMTSNP
jgi:hypothetical protein